MSLWNNFFIKEMPFLDDQANSALQGYEDSTIYQTSKRYNGEELYAITYGSQEGLSAVIP